MNKWMKRLLVVFQIGGSFAGLVINLQYLVARDVPVSSAILGLIFTAIFVFGIIAGVALIENERAGIVLSRIFQGMQIPFLSSGIIVYKFSCGLGFYLIRLEMGMGHDHWFGFGCHYALHLFRESPWAIGVNVVALVFFIYLVRLRKRKPEGDTTAE
jgi:hypothetical protein